MQNNHNLCLSSQIIGFYYLREGLTLLLKPYGENNQNSHYLENTLKVLPKNKLLLKNTGLHSPMAYISAINK